MGRVGPERIFALEYTVEWYLIHVCSETGMTGRMLSMDAMLLQVRVLYETSGGAIDPADQRHSEFLSAISSS